MIIRKLTAKNFKWTMDALFEQIFKYASKLDVAYTSSI